jgi:hypothetical protein
LHSRWAEQVTEQIYRYIDDHFPDGLHVPPDVSEDEAVIAVQNQFSDAGFRLSRRAGARHRAEGPEFLRKPQKGATVSESDDETSSNMPSDLRERLDAALEGLIDVLALQVQGQIENELADGIVDLWFEDIIDILTKADGYNSPEEFAAAIETKAPEIAKNIRSLDIKDWTTLIGFLTAVITLILSLSKVWDQPPPSPTVIQQIVVNQITNVIQVPSAPK